MEGLQTRTVQPFSMVICQLYFLGIGATIAQIEQLSGLPYTVFLFFQALI